MNNMKIEEQSEFEGENNSDKEFITGVGLARTLELDPEEMSKDPIRMAKFELVIGFFGKLPDPEFIIEGLYRRKKGDMDRLNYMYSYARLNTERDELTSKRNPKRSERKRLEAINRELRSFE